MRRLCIWLLSLPLILVLLALPVTANSPPSAELGNVVLTPGAIFIFIFAWVASILFGLATTLIPEWLVALAFRLDRKARRLVLLTNLISQATMWAAVVLFFLVDAETISRFLTQNYLLFLVVLEVPIYFFEFLWYRKKLLFHTWQKCLAFSMAANSASLLVGLLPFLDLF